MNDKISIILPVYNVEKYLNKCIDSILNQTYTNFELIIINDGSTDNSGNICEEYKLNDNRIILIHQDNLGLSCARNKGIDLSTGKYITFIDSDDYIDNKYIETLHTIISKNNADISMCNHIEYSINMKKHNKIVRKYNIEFINKEDAYKRMILEKNIYFMVWSKMYKKEIFNNVNFAEGKLYEDLFIATDIIEASNKIVVSNYNGYYYLRRNESITYGNMTNRYMDLIDATKIFNNYLSINYPQLKEYILKRKIISYFVIYRKALLNKNYKTTYKSLRKEILKYKKEIFKSKLYNKKEKLQTFLLLFGNTPYKIFYKIYKRLKEC